MTGLYKLLCIDLDGTLIGQGGVISDYSISVLRKAQQKGAIICVASGRPYCQIVPFTTQIGLKTPLVACNGAHVYDPASDEFWMREDLPVEESLKFLKFCDENEMQWYIYGHYSISSRSGKHLLSRHRSFEEIYTANGIKIPETYTLVTEQDYIDALKRGAGKISVRVTPREIEMIEDYYKTYRPGTVCKKAATVLMETMNEKASKWDAVKVMAKHLGVNEENICVFGDNMNDLEMIQNSPTSFAMCNGDERIFPYATHVIGRNDEDGVAKAIEKYIMDNIIA